MDAHYWQRFWQARASRRRLLRGVVAVSAAGGGLALLGCGGDGEDGQQEPEAGAQPAEQPRSGDELHFAVADAPPSFDGHRETTFAMLHPLAPHYSTLLRFDQDDFPKIAGDLAESWSTPDAQTVILKLRNGVLFHDGSLLTPRDVQATFERIINPPAGVASARRASFAAVDRIEVPDSSTITFKLKQPSASFMTNLASPWNFIYKAETLAQDARWPERNVMGTGPFRFVEYVPGSHWVARRHEDYFIKGRPYIDGYRGIIVRDTAARVNAVRSGQALIEFRGFSPEERDTLQRAIGDRLTVQTSPWTTSLSLVFNTEKRPFNDTRVRRALSLALDRWGGSPVLSRISVMGPVGGAIRPGSEFATPEKDLVKLADFGKDVKAAQQEARQLLKAAGAEGATFTLKNRNIKEPYEAGAVFVIDQWRQVGLTVAHEPLESGAWLNDLRAGNYDASVDFASDFIDEPDIQLQKFVSAGENNPINYGRYTDRSLDDLYERQARTTDQQQRLSLVRQFEKRVLDEQAYQFHILWWQRIVPHWQRMRGWKITPSHYVNQDLRDVWLAQA
jgi:peptide/nickel transport system substrate-binding protein